MQQDKSWHLLKHVPRVLIDQFHKFLDTFLIDKWSFSIDDQTNIKEVNYNTWTCKFDNFFEFRNVISFSLPPASVIMIHCVRKWICDSPLSCNTFVKWQDTPLTYPSRVHLINACPHKLKNFDFFLIKITIGQRILH